VGASLPETASQTPFYPHFMVMPFALYLGFTPFKYFNAYMKLMVIDFNFYNNLIKFLFGKNRKLTNFNYNKLFIFKFKTYK